MSVVILWGQRVAPGNSDNMLTANALVQARVWCRSTCAVNLVECCVGTFYESRTFFIKQRGHKRSVG